MNKQEHKVNNTRRTIDNKTKDKTLLNKRGRKKGENDIQMHNVLIFVYQERKCEKWQHENRKQNILIQEVWKLLR